MSHQRIILPITPLATPTIDTTEPDGSDDYTNDETTTANLTLGVAETGTFSLFGDVDWWGVNLEADTYYQIIVTNADANPTENYNFWFE